MYFFLRTASNTIERLFGDCPLGHGLRSASRPFLLLATVLSLGLLFPQQAEASHIAASEMVYHCIDSNRYVVRVTVYVDCAAGLVLQPTQQIYWGSDSCGIATQVDSLPLLSVVEVTTVCPTATQATTCQSPFGIFLGIEEYVYEDTLTLPQACPDWTFGWALAARNPNTTNLDVNLSTNIYIETTLDNTDIVCNSSPVFEDIPLIYTCEDQPFCINLGGYDPDNDSLAYELVDPRDFDFASATSFPIPYFSPFSPSYPVSTSPAFTFSFEEETGQMCFTPDQPQRSIVAVLVKEYRDGELIGTVIRDMTLVVLDCNNENPIIDPPSNVLPSNSLNGSTFSVCIGQTLNFEITGNDPDGGPITVESNLPQATPVPPAVYSQSVNGSNFTIQFNWTPSPGDEGIYFFNVRANDDDCPYIGEASVGYRIIVSSGQILPDQNILVCPTDTAPIQVQATGYDPAIVYDSIRWLPDTGLSNAAIHNPIIDPTSQAEYLVVLYPSGPGNCPVIERVVIQPDDLIELADDTLSICRGDTVLLDPSLLSSGNASWDWTPDSTLSSGLTQMPSAFPDTTTVYTVIATTTLCQYQADIRVEVLNPPTLDPQGDALLCNGDTLTLDATGSNLDGLTPTWSPSTYISDPNSFVTEVFPFDTTVYTITVGNQCDTVSESIEVQVVPLLSLNSSSEDILCNGESNGQIEVIPIGGSQSGLTYSWAPNVSTTNIADSLPAGSYSVVVQDAAGCVDTLTASVDEPPSLVAQVDSIQMINCFGQSNGQVIVSATGGTGDYSYSLDGSTYFLNSTFFNLPAGTYTVFVQDENGCIDDTQQAVVTEPTAPIGLQLISVVNANCNTPLGEILVQASGGTPGYTFTIDGNPAGSPLFQGLLPGNYFIEVVDTNGCNTALNVPVVEFSDPRLDLLSQDNPACYGDSTGSVLVAVNDGLPPYDIDGGGGLLPDTTLAAPDTFAFSGLPAGSYTVTLTDANNCQFTLTFVLGNPDSLFANVSLIQIPLCSYTADGVALMQGQGGTEPLLYALNGGPLGTVNVFTDLAANTPYTLTLVDSLGCQVDQTVSIQGPPPLQMFPTVDTVSCPGGADGSVTIQAQGGNPDYEYSIDDQPFGNPLPFGDDSVFINLLAGSYEILVQDDNGCRDSIDVRIPEPDPLSVSPLTISDVDCFGAATGSIDLIGAGGTPPYRYAVNFGPFDFVNTIPGLRQGDYTVIMRDANGCTIDTTVSIDQPARLTGSITSQPVICYGDSNGVAQVFMQGGTPPYRYLWSNGAMTQQVFNLPPGNPQVLITDENDCQYAISTEILEPPQMQFDTTGSTDASCFGLIDGTLIASASGGTDTLSYEWSNGSTDTFQVVGAGVYDIVVTDGNGCTIEDTLEVGEPPEIVIDILARQAASCGAPTGEVLVEATGGFGGYTYQWETDPPQLGPQVTGLFGGPDFVYTVRVRDEEGCENTLDVGVGLIEEPTADFEHSFAPLDTILLPEEGVQFINRSRGGVAYLWSFGDGGLSNEVHPDHIYRSPGTYTIKLISIDDGFACPDTTEQTLVLLPPGAIYVPNVFTPNGDGNNEGWSPVGIGVAWVESRLYTRWGDLITTLNSMDEKWYGELPNNQVAPEGVYVYVVRAVLNNGREFMDVGTVTLVR